MCLVIIIGIHAGLTSMESEHPTTVAELFGWPYVTLIDLTPDKCHRNLWGMLDCSALVDDSFVQFSFLLKFYLVGLHCSKCRSRILST